jgi:4-amino-4-deoxy-L-arabinose transferase-like glycosyltransferase
MKFKFRKEFAPIIAIILLGALLRIYRIRDYIVFLGDEGRDALVVWNILHGHLTLLGPTASVGGFFLGPIYYYMMAPFLLLSRFDPVGPAVMVALFGLATIYLIYRLSYEFFGKKAAIISSLLYATAPIIVNFSRSSWNPNVMPFFSLATLYALYKAEVKNNSKLFVLTGFLFGITMQLHYLATFLGTVMFFYLLASSIYFKKYKELVKKYALMFAGFLVGFSPFLLFEARHNFTNTSNVIRFVLESGDTGAGGKFFSIITFVFTRLFGGITFNFPLPGNFYMFDPNLIKIWFIAFSLFSLASLAYFLFRFKKDMDWHKYSLIFLWGFLGIVMFGFYKKPIYDYYLGFLFPFPFLIIGIFLAWLAKSKVSQILVGVLVLGLVLLNFNFSHQRTEPNRLVDQTQSIDQFVLNETHGKPYNFALLSSSNTDLAYRYFFKLEKKEPVEILPPGVDPDRKSVTDQLFVVCENNNCQPLGNSQWEVAGFGQADLADQWDLTVVKVYKLIHHKGK